LSFTKKPNDKISKSLKYIMVRLGIEYFEYE
jgi:hypothetical protein